MRTEKSSSDDFLIRFYIKCIFNIARVTIMMVKLKATTIEHKRHIDKDDNKEVDHTQKVTDVKYSIGYLIIIENKNQLEQRFNVTLKELPERLIWIPYLKEALELAWKDDNLIDAKYSKLTA